MMIGAHSFFAEHEPDALADAHRLGLVGTWLGQWFTGRVGPGPHPGVLHRRVRRRLARTGTGWATSWRGSGCRRAAAADPAVPVASSARCARSSRSRWGCAPGIPVVVGLGRHAGRLVLPRGAARRHAAVHHGHDPRDLQLHRGPRHPGAGAAAGGRPARPVAHQRRDQRRGRPRHRRPAARLRQPRRIGPEPHRGRLGRPAPGRQRGAGVHPARRRPSAGRSGSPSRAPR